MTFQLHGICLYHYSTVACPIFSVTVSYKCILQLHTVKYHHQYLTETPIKVLKSSSKYVKNNYVLKLANQLLVDLLWTRLVRCIHINVSKSKLLLPQIKQAKLKRLQVTISGNNYIIAEPKYHCCLQVKEICEIFKCTENSKKFFYYY